MNNDAIASMSRAVAAHFGLWTPGQMCNYGDVRCRHLEEPLADTWDELTQGKFKPHEIPCPDLTQAEHFVRLLKELWPNVWHILFSGTAHQIRCEISWRYKADVAWSNLCDTPEEALLLAAYQLVPREVAK